jgi:hypothetical protein
VGQSLERHVGRQRALAATQAPGWAQRVPPSYSPIARWSRDHCTLAARAPLEICLSHPPALQLGAALGGGWVGHSLESHVGRQRALAATQAPGWAQRVPPSYSPIARWSRGHCTLAARAPLEICLSHPPALRLASVLGGGWVGQFLERHVGRQRALAATLAATIDQLWRPTSSQRASKCRSLKRWRMALRRQYTCIGAPSPLRS